MFGVVPAARTPFAVLALLATSACTDLSEYEGTYRGRVVGTSDGTCAGCSAFRRGFPENTELVYVRATADGQGGAITTCPPPSATSPCTMMGTCAPCAATPAGTAPPEDRAFDGDPLRAIVALEHDQLSHYDFPGGGRLRNYVYVVSSEPDGPLAGREAMVFVSLMESGAVEVRVIAGSGELAGDHFGLFVLRD